MAHRRSLVFLLLVVAGVVGATVATGAYTTITAERTVSVTVTGDDSALLQMAPHTGPNGLYAQQTASGEIEIRLDGALGLSNGMNLDSTTTLNNVFNVTNQGSQPVGVWITKTGPNANLVSFETGSGVVMDGSSANAQNLTVGSTIEVTIVVDTAGQTLSSGDVLLNSITVHADADQA